MINNNSYYVYRYVDDISGTVLYIGKGKGDRYKHHLQTVESKKRTRFLNKLRQLNNLGTPATVELLVENLTEEQAFAKEIEFIKIYGRKSTDSGTLYNMTDGGEGCSLTGESLVNRNKAIAKANMGRFQSDATKLKISKQKKKFYVNNPEAKAVVSERLAKFREDPVVQSRRKDAAIKANTGRKISPEHLDVMLELAASANRKSIVSSAGTIFGSAKEAAEFFGVSVPIIRNMCCGKREAPISGVFLSYKKEPSWLLPQV